MTEQQRTPLADDGTVSLASNDHAQNLAIPSGSTAESPRDARSAAAATYDSPHHDHPSVPAERALSSEQPRRRALAAVVDDHPACRESLVELLGALGLQAVGFETAMELYSCATHALKDWQLFLIDHRLGRASGIECVRVLRRRGVSAPILLISAARPSSAEQEILHELGAQWLAKPIAVDALRERSGLVS